MLVYILNRLLRSKKSEISYQQSSTYRKHELINIYNFEIDTLMIRFKSVLEMNDSKQPRSSKLAGLCKAKPLLEK